MDEAREYNAKQNKSVRERPIPYDFTHMWNLRNKTKNKKRDKKKKNRLLDTECKLAVVRREVSGGRHKRDEEFTYDEH